MANKQVGVNIAFSADTSKAKASIQELQTLLNKITYSGVSSTGQTMTKDLQNASAAAKELQYHLNNAYNANTGKLDLSLLDKSLKTTGSNITNLSTQLLTAGTTGQQAFVKIAQSIAQAEQPVLRVNSKVKDLVKTLGNAAKYQLGNMVVQGMISSVSSAIGYAKDLNSSLNEIRIVSGKNADEMARFAEEANKAAKRLSATTLDYTNASVIYAQQGLNDDEIAARTETTIKMANVAGTSAQTVSDQMTAVWNNFYDGSKSLEYYSDVMVKLGAATASSTDEISEGVNKFAATAKTVGLSYEYATAALATVTATTRESADTVGNAYKTLFSRIQGLNLGETQDDGTTLNKYSQALANVGVNIKDTSGQLKDMDTILDELGEKWQTLAKDEQVALAETVGGARQYTQLMALLDNWDYFKENLDVAYNSEGSLEEQAQIYAESWDAASDRVQAAFEGIYQSILDDKFFISLNNGFANVLGGLEAFIEGAGGVKTIMTGIGSILLGMYADKIPSALQNVKYNFDILTKGSQEAYKTIQTQMQEATNAAFTKYQKTAGTSGIDINSATGVELQYTNDLFAAKNKLAQITDKMSAAEKQQYQTELSLIEAHQKETVALQRKCEELESSIELQRQELIGTEKYYGVDAREINNKQANIFGNKEDEYFNKASQYYDAGLKTESQSLYAKSENYGKASEIFADATDEIESFTQKVNQAYENLNNTLIDGLSQAAENREFYTGMFDDALPSVDRLKDKLLEIGQLDIDEDSKVAAMKNAINGLSEAIPLAVQEATGLKQIFDKINKGTSVDEITEGVEELRNTMEEAKIEGKDFDKVVSGFQNPKAVKEYIKSIEESNKKTADLASKKGVVQELINSFKPDHVIKTSEAIASAASALGNLATISNSFTSLFSMDEDLSGLEKFLSALTSIGFIIPQAITYFQSYGKVVKWISDLQTAKAKSQQEAATAEAAAIALAKTKAAADAKEVATQKIKNGLTDASKKGLYEQLAAILGVSTATEAEQILIEKGILVERASNSAIKETAKTRKEAIIALAAEIAAKKTNTAATEVETKVVRENTKEKQKNAAAGGAWGIALMVVAAAIGAVVAWIKKVKEEEEEAAKKAEELANKINELVKSNGELVDSYNDLMSQYHSVMEEYEAGQSTQEDVINIQDQLKEKALEVAEALGIEGIALKSLQGDFEDIQEIIDNERQKEIEEALKDNGTDNRNKGNAFIKAMRKDVGHQYGNNDYYAAIQGSKDDSGIKVSRGISSRYEHLEYKNDYTIGISAINNNASDYAKAYEDALNYQKELEDKYDLDTLEHSTIYKKLSSFLNKSSEAYEAYKASEEQIQSLKIESTALGFKIEKGVGLRDISSATEFDAYREQLIADIAETQGIEEEARNETNQAWVDIVSSVDAYLGTISSLSDYITKSKAFDEIAEKVQHEGETLENAKQRVIDAYDELDDEDKELFFQIDFNVYDAEDNLDRALAYLRAKAAQESIETKLDVVASGIDLLGDSKTTTDDIVAWAQQMTDAFGEDFDLASFLAKSSTEQTKYLQDKQTELKSASVENREERKKAAEQGIIDTKDELEGQEEQYSNAQDTAIKYAKLQAKYNEAVSQGTGAAFNWAAESEAEGIEGITSKDSFDQQVESNNALIDSYNELENKLKEYNQVVSDIEVEKQVEDAYGWRDALQEQAEALDISYDEIQEYANVIASTEGFAQYVDEINEALKEAEKPTKTAAQIAEEYALSYKKVEKGVKTAQDSLDDWKKAIKNSSKDITQYLKTVEEIKDVYKQVFNSIDSDVIDNLSDEFLTSASTMSLMEKALNGSAQDWNNWEAAVAAEINTVISKMPEMSESFKAQMDELTTAAANLDFSGLNPGADIDDSAFNNKLEQMAYATADAAQIMCDNLSNIGVDAEIEKHTYTAQPNTTYDRQDGVIIAKGPGGEITRIPVSAGIENFVAGQTYTWYTLKGAKYNGRGVRPTSAAPKTSSGGGSSSTPKHAEKKNDSDKERYHTITNQLEDISAEYDDISEAAERAFGKDKLKNLDAQIEKTDELISKQEEYLDAIEANLPVDKKVMQASYLSLIGGPEMEFDERGNISNYDVIQDAMYAKWNAMADAYDEDSTEWEVFEKKYEQLEKYIEQYEETYDLLRDEEQEYQDLLNQRIDLQLEKVQYTVEVQLEVSEDSLAVIEYQLGRIDDDGFKSLESIGLLSAKADEVYKQIQINKEGLNEALKLSLSAAEISQVMAGNMDVLNGKNFTEDQIDAIREYRDSLLELNEEFDDIREEIEEKLMEAFDAWQEKLEKGIDTIDHYGSVLESYKNIIDIVGTETLGLDDEFMNKLSQGSVDNAIDKLEATKAAYKSTQSALEQAEAKLAEARAAGDTKSAEMWEETIETLTEESQEAQENMLSAWEDALDKVAEQFEQSVERIIDSFNKSVYKLGGLEGLADDFSKEQERADMMLDDYEKIYELSKLSRDINKTIDDTDNLAGKQKLKKLLGEINDLQEDGVEMSQYDLEYLQKEYDLRLAEIELEEAQKAKNTVRLQKDNEGNWSYIYTQNADAVDEAQQKYEDALYAMQDVSSNYIDEMSEKLIETSQEMAEALAELRVEDFASIDEYYARVDEVQKYYQEQMDWQEEELNKAIANNSTLYEKDWKSYSEATGYKISDAEDFVSSFKDSLLGSLMNSESATANFNDLIAGSVETMISSLLEAANTYYENLENAMNAADTSIEDFGEDVGESIDQIADKSAEGAAAVEDMADRMNAAVNGVMDTIQDWQTTYGLAMENIIKDNLEVIESINDMVGALSLDDYDASVTWNFSKANASAFDTGGYTGNWGKEGKLAVLHEKELVLNADDTVNMLNALKLTADLLDMLELQTKNAQLGIGNLVANTIKDTQTEVLEQNVHITAEFPSVTDHNEVEEALLNLNNVASQYANRK